MLGKGRWWIYTCIFFLLNSCTEAPSVPTDPPTISPTTAPSSTAIASLVPSATNTESPTATPTSPPSLPPIAYEGDPLPRPTTVINAENAHQVVELAQWGRGVVQDIEYSIDGGSVVVTTTNGIYIHDADDFDAPPKVFHVDYPSAISPDLSVLATTEQVIRVSDGKVLLLLPEDVLSPLIVSSHGRYVAARHDQKLKVWDLENPQEIKVWSAVPHVIAFSPDEKTIAIRDLGITYLYDIEIWERTKIDRYKYWAGFDQVIEFSPDGNLFVVGNQPGEYDTEYHLLDETINIYNLQLGHYLEGIPPNDLDFDYRGVSCDSDFFTFEPMPPAYVDRIAFSPDGKIMAVVFREFTGWLDLDEVSQLVLYRTSDHRVIKKFNQGAMDVAFSPDGKRFITVSNDGIIEEWSLSNLNVRREIQGYNGRVLDISLSPDNRLIGIDYADRARLQDLQSGEIIAEYFDAQIAFSPDQLTFALGYKSGAIEIRDLGSKEILYYIFPHQAEITDIAYLPSGDLVSAGMDCMMNLWEMPSGVLKFAFEGYVSTHCTIVEGRYPVRDITPSKDGKFIVSDYDCPDNGLWETGSGMHLDGLPNAPYTLIEMAFNEPWYSSRDLEIPVEDVVDFSQQWEESWFLGDSAISPSGQIIVVDSYIDNSNAIGFYDPSSGEILYKIPTAQWKITKMVFSPGGEYFITSATDGTIRFWGIAP